MTLIKEKFWTMWEALLNDENGIGEEAFDALYDLAFEIDASKAVMESQAVDATDGRYYIPED